MAAATPFSQPCPLSMSSVASIEDGTFAPSMVSQKTTARIANMSGNPKMRLVSNSSNFRSNAKPTLASPRF